MAETDTRTDVQNDAPSSAGAPNSDALFELLSKIMSSQPTQKESDPQPPPQPSADALSSLLTNPEVLARLPQIMSVIKPLMGSMSTMQNPTENTSSQSSYIPTSAPLSTKPPLRSEADNRAALLCAMKPYMGKERREAIDYIIKLSKLGDILKSL